MTRFGADDEVSSFGMLVPAFVAFCVYAGTLGVPLVYDDAWTLGRLGGGTVPLLDGRGLTYAVHRLDAWLWGAWLPGFHLTNLLLHAAATLVATLAAEQMTGSRPTAFLAGLLFALHPVHVEAVASISYRKDLLAMIFAGAAFVLWRVSRRKPLAYIAALLCLGLGLLSKEAAVIGVVPVLLVDEWLEEPRRGRLALRVAPLALGGLVATALFLGDPATVFGRASIQSRVDVGLESYREVLAATLASVREQVRLLLFPRVLSAHYPDPPLRGLTDPAPLGGIALLGVAIVGCFAAARRSQPAFLAALWTISTFLPVSNVVPLTHYFVAERYLYVPSLGICVLAAMGFRTAHTRAAPGSVHRRIAAVVPAVLCALMAWRTIDRTLDWRSESELWRSSIRQGVVSPSIHANYGTALYREGRYEAAAPPLREAIRLQPTHARAHLNLGSVLFKLGDVAGAEEEYRTALRLQPRMERGQFNLGMALRSAGKLEEAVTAFSLALRRSPRDPASSYRLGETLLDLGRNDEAAEFLHRAVRLDPLESDYCGAAAELRSTTDDARSYLARCASRERKSSDIPASP